MDLARRLGARFELAANEDGPAAVNGAVRTAGWSRDNHRMFLGGN